MSKITHSINQFPDYLYYWTITTPYGSITATKGKKLKGDAKEEMDAFVAALFENVIGKFYYDPLFNKEAVIGEDIVIGIPRFDIGEINARIEELNNSIKPGDSVTPKREQDKYYGMEGKVINMPDHEGDFAVSFPIGVGYYKPEELELLTIKDEQGNITGYESPGWKEAQEKIYNKLKEAYFDMLNRVCFEYFRDTQIFPEMDMGEKFNGYPRNLREFLFWRGKPSPWIGFKKITIGQLPSHWFLIDPEEDNEDYFSTVAHYRRVREQSFNGLRRNERYITSGEWKKTLEMQFSLIKEEIDPDHIGTL